MKSICKMIWRIGGLLLNTLGRDKVSGYLIESVTCRRTRPDVPATRSDGMSNESPTTVPEIKLNRAYANTPRMETRRSKSLNGLP